MGGAPPRHLALDSSLRGAAARLGNPALAPALRSALEPVQRLDLEDPAVQDGQYPEHKRLIRRLLLDQNQNPADFILWRCDLQRPVPWIQSFLVWPHPDTPEACLTPAAEVYL